MLWFEYIVLFAAVTMITGFERFDVKIEEKWCVLVESKRK